MEKTDFSEFRCCLARSLDMIGDWWSPLIIRDIFLKVSRFDELVENLGISRNLLTQRLKSLIASGVIERIAYQSAPLRYEYRLTPAGQDLIPTLIALTAWGERWAPLDGGPSIFYRHVSCGCMTTVKITCTSCGEPMRTEDLEALSNPDELRGPGVKLLSRRLKPANA